MSLLGDLVDRFEAPVRRFSAPIAAGALCVVLAALYLTVDVGLYKRLFLLLGVDPYVPLFIDAAVLLTKAECHARGIDIYLTNPCDPLDRTEIYSPLLPYLSLLNAGAWNVNILGALLAVLYLAVLAYLLRPDSWKAAAACVLAAISPPAIYAVERGQLEIVLLALAALCVALNGRSLPWRCLGYAGALGAGLLKMFPMTLGALSLREGRHALWIAPLWLGVFAVTVVLFRREYALIMEMLPKYRIGYYADQFWVGNLPFRFSRLPRDTVPGRLLHLAVAAVFLAGAAALAWLLHRRGFRPDWDSWEAKLLLVGALLLTGCFMTDLNTYYRAIHMLFLLPFLLAAAAATGEAGQGLPPRAAWAMVALILVLMWIAVPVNAGAQLQMHGPAGLVTIGRRLSSLSTGLRDVGWLAAMLPIAAVAILGVVDGLRRFLHDNRLLPRGATRPA